MTTLIDSHVHLWDPSLLQRALGLDDLDPRSYDLAVHGLAS
jgi:hypothetical protein